MNTVLFDLDGTLLPMDQEAFTKVYFGLLAQKCAPYGYEPEALIDAVWAGTKAMVKNNGDVTNEQRFWGLGMDFYLVTDDLINAKGLDLSAHRQGSFQHCCSWLEQLAN